MYNLQHTATGMHATSAFIILCPYNTRVIQWPYILYSQSIYYISVSWYLKVPYLRFCALRSTYTLHHTGHFTQINNNTWPVCPGAIQMFLKKKPHFSVRSKSTNQLKTIYRKSNLEETWCSSMSAVKEIQFFVALSLTGKFNFKVD